MSHLRRAGPGPPPPRGLVLTGPCRWPAAAAMPLCGRATGSGGVSVRHTVVTARRALGELSHRYGSQAVGSAGGKNRSCGGQQPAAAAISDQW